MLFFMDVEAEVDGGSDCNEFQEKNYPSVYFWCEDDAGFAEVALFFVLGCWVIDAKSKIRKFYIIHIHIQPILLNFP